MSAYAKPFETIANLVGDLTYLDITEEHGSTAKNRREVLKNCRRLADSLIEQITEARIDDQMQRVDLLRSEMSTQEDDPDAIAHTPPCEPSR